MKIKLLSLLCFSILLSGCSKEDESYYRTDPSALSVAIKNCPAKSPANISCTQLTTLAVSMSQLAHQLRINPQGFGKKILALQEGLARQKLQARESSPGSEERLTIEAKERQLAEHLAVVRLLESPER